MSAEPKTVPAHDGEYRTSAAPPKREPTPDELDLVILETTHDPLRAQLLRGLLESAGIVVATPGLEHRAMLGALAGHVQISVRVPRKRFARAKRILTAYEADRPVYDRARRWRTAGLAAIAFPIGGGHLYAGAYASAAVLALAQALCAWGTFAGDVFFAPAFALGVVACDLVGSREACRRANANLPVRSGWLTRGSLVGFLLVIGLGASWAFAPSVLAGERGRTVCGYFARCTEWDGSECLHDFAQANVEHFTGSDGTRDCIRCVERRADQRCDAVRGACGDTCGWDAD